MKKNIKRVVMLIVTVVLMSASFEVLATSVPKKTEAAGSKDKYSSDTQKVIETVNENKTETKKDTENEKKEVTETPKATQKAAKATASPKTTEKATEKATTKKTTQSTVATITPEENDEDEKVTTTEEADDNVIVVGEEAPEPELNVVTKPETVANKKYQTKGGAFGMFLLTVLVSAVLSFLISYRFYKMNRMDNHVMAEIRALKRDIDTKMSGTVGGFSEYETKTTNNNPSFAREGRPVRRTQQAGDGSDMYAKWESQINSTPRSTQDTARRAERNTERAARYSRARKQKSAAAKIKDVFDDIFSKRK